MADVLGKKISELAETTDLAGLYTIGSDRNNQSKKVPLQFVKEAADYANAQGDYAKGVGDSIQSETTILEFDSQILVFEPQNNILSKKQLYAPYLKKGRKYRFTFLNKGWDMSGVTNPYNGFSIGYVPKGQQITDANYKTLVVVTTSELNTLLKDYYDIEITDDWEWLNIELRASEKVYIRCEDLTNIAKLASESLVCSFRVAGDGEQKYPNIDTATGIMTFHGGLSIGKKSYLVDGKTVHIKNGLATSAIRLVFNTKTTEFYPVYWEQELKEHEVAIGGIRVNYSADGTYEYFKAADFPFIFTIDGKFPEEIEKDKSIRYNNVLAFRASHNGSTKGVLSASPFIPYMGFEQRYLGKNIVGVRANIGVLGVFSVVKVTGDVRRDGSLDLCEISVIKEFSLKTTGLNTLYFDEPIKLEKGEYLGFQVPSDTAQLIYESNRFATENPIHFLYRYADTNTWEEGKGQDLQVEVIVEYAIESYLSGKKISVLGDSISTFEGVIPEGNAAFYPKGDIISKVPCWWHRLISLCRAKLEVNQSWSGSRITTTGTEGVSFTNDSRIKQLGNPDVIFVFGGTNDFGQSNPAELGDYVLSSATKDLTKFKQAYQYMVETLLTTYPRAEVILLVPMQRTSFGLFGNNAKGWSYQDLKEVVITIADMYGVKYIDLSKCGINQGNLSIYTIDGLHPNIIGMGKITDYIMANL